MSDVAELVSATPAAAPSPDVIGVHVPDLTVPVLLVLAFLWLRSK